MIEDVIQHPMHFIIAILVLLVVLTIIIMLVMPSSEIGQWIFGYFKALFG
jgi:hypothetical protein